MKKVQHTIVKGIRMTPEVAAMLAELAYLEGMSEQSVIRLLIRRSHAARAKK
jgi:hypothetical protein